MRSADTVRGLPLPLPPPLFTPPKLKRRLPCAWRAAAAPSGRLPDKDMCAAGKPAKGFDVGISVGPTSDIVIISDGTWFCCVAAK